MTLFKRRGRCRVLQVPPVILGEMIYAGPWQLDGFYLRDWWARNNKLDVRRNAAR